MPNTTLHIQYDVCVIGAGPAGSTIANRLVDFGYSVVLIDKKKFPRSHIGLSLTSGIHHWLNVLDIKEQVEQLHFKRANKTIVLWKSKEPLIKNFENDKAGYHLDRGRFDALLVDECRQKKVKIIQPGIIKNLKQTKDGSWKMKILNETQEYRITSSFVVDSCGRKSILKNNKIPYLPKLLATYAYWESDNKSKNDYSFIEASNTHWYWGAPINNDNFVLCIFSDPSKLKEASSIDQFYIDIISKSKFASPIISEKNIKGTISVCDATPYYDSNVIGDNFIKIGDSAYTMDPISSQGVQKAIKSGIQAAIIVNTILKKRNSFLALRYYRNLIKSEVRKNKGWTTDFYREQGVFLDSTFWKSRKKIEKNKFHKQDEHILLKKEDVLTLNKNGKFLMVPILGENEVIEIEGFLINEENEPFVFVETIHIAPLLKLINKKTFQECIRIMQDFTRNKNEIKLIQWLLYHNILTKQDI